MNSQFSSAFFIQKSIIKSQFTPIKKQEYANSYINKNGFLHFFIYKELEHIHFNKSITFNEISFSLKHKSFYNTFLNFTDNNILILNKDLVSSNNECNLDVFVLLFSNQLSFKFTRYNSKSLSKLIFFFMKYNFI